MIYRILNRREGSGSNLWLYPGEPIVIGHRCTLQLLLNTEDGIQVPTLELRELYGKSVEAPIYPSVKYTARPLAEADITPLVAELDREGNFTRVFVNIITKMLLLQEPQNG